MPPPERSRFLTFLGLLAILMGGWGLYFCTNVYGAFDQLVQSYKWPNGSVTYGPRSAVEPWVLSYCGVSAILMIAAGIGLLRRRRWGPAAAGFAGAAWMVTSFGILWSEIRFLRGYAVSPPTVRIEILCAAGAALLVVLFGGLCFSCLARRRTREECGAETPGRAVRVLLFVWTVYALGVSKFWYDWLWNILSPHR